MESTDGSDRPSKTRQSKVGRLIEEYGLESLEEGLAQQWTAEENRLSLRELAEEFNERLLREAMEDAGLQPLEGEAENLYRLLDGDDVSSGARVEATRRLEREGIDVDTLHDDFVSHQAIHTFLTSHQGVSPPSADGDGVEASHRSIKRLQNRTTAVVENTLSALRNKDELDLPAFEVFVDVRVMCTNCETQHEVTELIMQGGCDCEN